MNNLRPSLLAASLFTKAQQQVLGLLFSYPENSFYQNEIIDFADMGKGSIVRELRKLESTGLIVKTRVGNQLHYQADANSIIFAELCSVVNKTLGREELIRSAIESLSNFVDQAFIYGNFVTGRESADEPILVILVSDRLTDGSALKAFSPVEEAIGVKIDFKILDKNQYAERITRKQSFISQVMAQPKLWLIQKRGE
jgi:hypothetical protein